MFDAMTTSCSAVVSSEDKLERAEDCHPRVMSLASEHEESDQEHCRDLDTENQVIKLSRESRIITFSPDRDHKMILKF